MLVCSKFGEEGAFEKASQKELCFDMGWIGCPGLEVMGVWFVDLDVSLAKFSLKIDPGIT